MARKSRKSKETDIQDYRHDTATRKNNPPAGLASQGMIQETPKQEYAYNPHLPPVLRFDESGEADRLPELLEKAREHSLTDDELKILAEALRHQEPWLEWSGKREAKSFAVEPVALHIHERVSAKAILRIAARQDVQRDLFADPEQEYREAVQFYQHDVDWSNRLILGDSLMVMSSLARREDLAGKVQMIYIDPPYGIKFSSNFQPTVFQRDVKDRSQDLTREPEQIKAYRDTWNLGIHSYLAYLRDRLIVAKELLADSGSIFVQIGDENVHRVRCLLDEVFGSENFVSIITFRKKFMSLSSQYIDSMFDYILFYAKNKDMVKYRTLFKYMNVEGDNHWNYVEFPDGSRKRMSSEEVNSHKLTPSNARIFQLSNLYPAGINPSGLFEVEFNGRKYYPPKGNSWKTNSEGMKRLVSANRVSPYESGDTLRYVLFLDDYSVTPINNLWDKIPAPSGKIYVVQTTREVIQRCLLMTTDPGDLVLDPTCGSGTTAYVAEQWGRRWIAIDTSRVAIALARQRLLTATFDYYKLKDESEGISGGFIYKTVPHITLKSIAQNVALDPIFAKHEPILAEKLEELNRALTKVTPEIRAKLLVKLVDKEKQEGKRAITEADKRRWQLPKTEWKEWEVPFDTDEDWPSQLLEALVAYRKAWRAKMDEVNDCIAASSDGEELVDQPELDRKKLRVSGPFTVEAVQPAEESLDLDSPIDGAPDELETFADDKSPTARSSAIHCALSEPTNAEAYLDQMIRLLRNDGVRFPNNKTMKFAELEALEGDVLHAEGAWQDDNGERQVAVSFGPQHGPVTALQVEDCLRVAYRRGYDELVFAGFSFDGAAQATIQEDPNPRVRVHMAHINPDITMSDLLKDTPNSQLFTVFGLPRTSIQTTKNGEYIVKMEGVDIYNPVDNSVYSAGADKVAAWFLDSDYDGRTFCITQAFFPDKKAWSKIARALKGVIDEERFESFSGTESLPFPAGEHNRVAVKVIDPRGNEVMRVHNLKYT